MSNSSSALTIFGAANRRVIIALYASAVFLFWAAQYIYVPTLPTYVQTKTDQLTVVGVVLSMYGLWQGIIRLPLGIAADWAGWRKPFTLIGLALSGVGAWMLATATSVDGLTLGRAITGLAAGTWVTLVVTFSALFPPAEAVRASALLTFIGSLGRILATAVNGSLNAIGGYALAFYVALGIAVCSLLLVLPMRETRRPPKPPTLKNIGRIIARRDVILPSMLGAIVQYTNWAIPLGFVTVLAKQLGASGVTQSVLVTLHITALATGNLISTTLAERVGAHRLVYASFVSAFIGTLIATFASALPMLFVGQVFLGLAVGVGVPVLMGLSIQFVGDAERATAMGVHQSVYSIGMFVGPALSGVIADWIGLQPMFAVTACACLVLGWFGTRALYSKLN